MSQSSKAIPIILLCTIGSTAQSDRTWKSFETHFPVAQNSSQYCVLLLYWKACTKLDFIPIGSTALYYMTCTKHVPGLLCTTNLLQNTSHCCFAPQCKCCAKHFPVLVLQSLHRSTSTLLELGLPSGAWSKECEVWSAAGVVALYFLGGNASVSISRCLSHSMAWNTMKQKRHFRWSWMQQWKLSAKTTMMATGYHC